MKYGYFPENKTQTAFPFSAKLVGLPGFPLLRGGTVFVYNGRMIFFHTILFS